MSQYVAFKLFATIDIQQGIDFPAGQHDRFAIQAEAVGVNLITEFLAGSSQRMIDRRTSLYHETGHDAMKAQAVIVVWLEHEAAVRIFDLFLSTGKSEYVGNIGGSLRRK